jgi:cephalosporin-C deacetylase-like acetyl esterase
MLIKSTSGNQKKNHRCFGLTFSLFIVAMLLLSIVLAPLNINNHSLPSVSTNSDNFDILNFWDTEMARVNNTPLDIVYGNNRTIEHSVSYTGVKYELNAQDISFVSPNWVGATPQNLIIRGVLLYPDEIKSSNPGVLCMHGLNGNYEDAFDLAIPYLEKGFVVLCHSHPGHGNSEGAEPKPSNLYYTGAYNKSAHFYLTLCAAIQGLRVLESLSFVNNSQIIVTGKSYGGLNAMWLAGIAGERIAGVSVYIAVGDIAKDLLHPEKLIFWVLGKSPKQIPDSYLTNQLLRFDPIYYLKSPKVPPILWQIGTNDDFFHYSLIRGTYDAVQHRSKYLQIFPNEHHGFPGFEGTVKYFIDYIVNKGSEPPRLNITNTYKTQDLRGGNFHISLELNSTKEVESVQIVYKFTDIIGTCWTRMNLINVDENIWDGEVNPTIFNSNLDYYIIINLKNGSNVWFSSNIFSGGFIKTNLEIPFIILISLLVVIPIAIAIRRKFRKLAQIDSQKRIKVNYSIFFEVTMVFLLDFVYYLAILLPWIVYESGGIALNHIYFFNNIYTWKLNVGEIAPFLTAIFFIASIVNSQLNFINLRLSALLKLIYPTLILGFISATPFISGALDPSSLVSNFGITFPGIGPFLMIISAISLFILGRWEHRKKISLGVWKKKKLSLNKLKEKIRSIIKTTLRRTYK